jgi:hypothetical protein
MKVQRILILTLVVLSCGFRLQAQELLPADSTVQTPHIDIFTLLDTPNDDGQAVRLHQSALIQRLVDNYIVRNHTKKTPGFRVRIFFDNTQSARQRAFEAEATFHELYPEVPAYPTYQDLFFKVTVGDFRTRTDAMRFLISIRENYPGAFIVKENINFPAL